MSPHASIESTKSQLLERWIPVHPDYFYAMRRVLGVLLILFLIQLLVWATPEIRDFTGIRNYLLLHGLMETISIVIAMMVFAVGWSERSDNITGHTNLLACGFFAVACLDFSHTFAYTGMPDYLTANDSEKHLSFWLSARLLAAVTLLALMLPWKLRKPGHKYILFFGVLSFVALVHWVVIFHQYALPHLFLPEEGLTPLKTRSEYLCIALNLLTAVLLLRRMRHLQPYDAPLLFAAVCVLAMSEFFFTLYTTMVGAFNVLGHAYKVIAYLYIYRSLVIYHIDRPYLELEAAQEKLEIAVHSSNIGFWDWNFFTGQLSMSPVWLSQLGYQPNELPQTFEIWEQLLHPDDRDAAIRHVKDCATNLEVTRYENEYRMRHKNGDYRWILARAEKQRDADGQMHRLVGSHLDITERKRAEDRFRTAVEASPTGMIMVDSSGQIVLSNTRAEQMLGYKSGELNGQALAQIIPVSSRTDHAAFVQGYLIEPSERPMGVGRKVNARHRDGHDIRVEVGLTPVEGQDERYVLASVQDITARLETDRRINQLIYFDTLTDLPNRNLLFDRIIQAIALAARDQRQLAVLFCEIYHFKHLNDILGNRAGDELLQAVVRRLAELVREPDTLSRVGSDEFVIVLNDSGFEASARLAAKLQEAIARPFQLGEKTIVIASSVGIAVYPEDGLDHETLYQRANTAMNRAKFEGRNERRFFTPDIQLRSERMLLLENALYHALERDEFFLNYQPQLCIDGTRVIGVEALLRWKHPELGLVSPAEFIPLAESNGMIISIGGWVLRTAAKQMRAWLDEGLSIDVMAVNLSAVQFRDSNLPSLVGDVLQQTSLAPRYLELELTESVAMDNAIKAIAMIDKLSEGGVRMSIDDFGTGYSSLNYLKKFNIYKIKIDKSFIRDIATDDDDRAIVAAIIYMAHSLGFRTIAEGVETVEQRDILLKYGCDEVQGYLYSPPVSANDLSDFVKSIGGTV